MHMTKPASLSVAWLFLLVGCGLTTQDPPGETPEETPTMEGTERVATLARENCDGSVERFAWCEGEATYLCYCRTPDDCTVSNQSCPGVSGSPLNDDTGLWCCTECEGIVDGVVEYEICS